MEKVANKVIFVTTLVAGTYIGLKAFTFTVDGGQRGFLFDRSTGLQPKIYGEGIHLKLPFVQSPIIQEIRLQAKSVALMALTKDQQTVDIAVRMLHAPIEEHLVEIQKTIGLNYEEKILPSIASEVLNRVVAQYDTNQLVSMNEKVSQEVKEGLTVKAKEFKIIIQDVSIIHLGFSREYAQAIEQKFVAKQQAQRQMFIVEKDDVEKTAKVIISEGEAIAAQIINEAAKKYGGVQIEIRRLEATKIFAEMMANLLNLVNQKKQK
ncbi:hypothetical protein pb186bvf_010874 [Paramecium bursaria]